jgi:hypothetical protein
MLNTSGSLAAVAVIDCRKDVMVTVVQMDCLSATGFLFCWQAVYNSTVDNKSIDTTVQVNRAGDLCSIGYLLKCCDQTQRLSNFKWQHTLFSGYLYPRKGC